MFEDLILVLTFSVQERSRHIGSSLVKNCEDDEGTGVSVMKEQAGTIQLEESSDGCYQFV